MPTATAEPRLAGEPAGLLHQLAHEHVDAASYVAFRIGFGALVVATQVRFVAKGWVGEFLLAPDRHLRYPGTGWLPDAGPIVVWAAIATSIAAGLAIALGRHTGTAALAFVGSFGFLESIDASLYLNHYWFVTLAGVVLAVLPEPTAGRVPLVNVVALRAQLAVVYVFAGIAKLNEDWLLRAEPLATWLPARSDRPLVGPLLEMRWTAFTFSWVGALFDLTIVGWLLWSRSRPVAYGVLVTFHLATAALFQIGVFPWVMIALTPVFFAPDWPRRWWPRRTRAMSTRRPLGPGRGIVLGLLATMNVVLPLRHLAADGNVRWNDDGYLFAWRVLLTERVAFVQYEVTDPATGDAITVRPDDVLTEWQAAAAMRRPDLILATGQLIASDARRAGIADPEVRADAWVVWNGRPSERWIDPDVDLTDISRYDPHAAFVLPEPEEPSP